MGDKQRSLSIESLEKSFNVLKEFSKHDKTDQEKAGIIKAFEFCYELSWKAMKKVLFIKGIEVNSPKDTFREAARVGLIEDPLPWFHFLEKRNETVHTYDFEVVEKLIKVIPSFKKEVSKLIEALRDALK